MFIENCPKEGSNAILLSNMKIEENQSVRASPKAEPSNTKYLKKLKVVVPFAYFGRYHKYCVTPQILLLTLQI